MARNKEQLRFSPAHTTGICLLSTAFLLSLIRIDLALLPLTVFVGLCAVAPFFPKLEFFLPVVNRGITRQKAVAITFDDGPDPITTPILLQLLSKHRMRATFFVNGHRTARHPELIRRILREGHTLGNHSHGHDNFLMLRSENILYREIVLVQQALKKFGVITHAFRPPVCITNPKLGKVLHELGMYAAGFGCRAPDGGNRWVKNLSGKILKKISPGDIVLLHDAVPPKKDLLPIWRREMDTLLQGLTARGFRVLDLSSLIGREVMTKVQEEEPSIVSFSCAFSTSNRQSTIDNPSDPIPFP